MRKNQVVGTKKYFLKSKDKIILSFDISQEIDNYKITTYHCQNIVLSEHEELLPKGMMIRDKTESGLQHWFEKRKASEHRPNSLRFLNCGGSPGDLLRYLEINRGMSLNDTYWVAPVGEDIRWGEVSPYSNVLDKENRFISVEWNQEVLTDFITNVEITTDSSKNYLLDIISKATSKKVFVDGVKTKNKELDTVYEVTIKVKDKNQLEDFMNSLYAYKFVKKVSRK